MKPIAPGILMVFVCILILLGSAIFVLLDDSALQSRRDYVYYLLAKEELRKK